MTESGNVNPFSRNNDLGGHEYTDEEQRLIMALSGVLRGRDKDLSVATSWAAIRKDLAPRPRDYIFLYVKAAGFVFELVKNLKAYPLPKPMAEKSVADWLEIVTGYAFEVGEEKTPAPPEEPSPTEIVIGIDMAEREDHLMDAFYYATGGRPMVADPLGLKAFSEEPRSRKQAIEEMSPERAKAILLRITDLFPGFTNGEDAVPGADLVDELGLLLRSCP